MKYGVVDFNPEAISKLKHRGVPAFFGDAASNNGNFHESINMAAAWKLPVVYICENNLYGISVDIRKVTNTKNIADRACAYNIPGYIVDGNDVLEVYEVAKKAIENARDKMGPTLIECKTYRWKGHHLGDPGIIYRAEEERKAWKDRCPIKSFRERLLKENILSQNEITLLESETKEMIEEAIDFAVNGSFPKKEEAYEDVFIN
jgi:pyruvate dehydrogenase E1 component alpha subunit